MILLSHTIHYDESNMREYKQSFATFRILYYKFLTISVCLVFNEIKNEILSKWK
jgi:hypothetical protein